MQGCRRPRQGVAVGCIADADAADPSAAAVDPDPAPIDANTDDDGHAAQT